MLRSIKERIPAIEKRFKMEAPTTTKKGKVVEKVNGKVPKKMQQKDNTLEKEPSNDQKERE